MDEFILFDNNKHPTQEFYNKLSKDDKEAVDKFEKYCLVSASPRRAQKAKSNAIRLIIMAEKPLKNIKLEDLQDFIRVLNKTNLSDYFKNDVKGYVQRFLRWHFKDWSERFNNLEDIKFISEPQRKKAIKPDDVLNKEDVEKLIKGEPDLFWKTFLVCQYEGALRTQETRTLKWDMINMDDPDVYWLNVKSKKNKNAQERERSAPPLDQKAVYYINELKNWQRDMNIKSPYLFPSKQDPNSPISSPTTNMWFRRLTKKVLGKPITNYLLRHSKGEHLHKLVREGKLSKENAILMMGHSEKMFDKTYSHTDKKELLKVIKKQVLDIDYIAPEKKHKLEEQLQQIQERLSKLEAREEKSMKEFIGSGKFAIVDDDGKIIKAVSRDELKKTLLAGARKVLEDHDKKPRGENLSRMASE